MENNSTGGNDKRSWRERLGIGTKELPKISEEFKAPSTAQVTQKLPPVSQPKPGEAKVAQRSPQPVVRPAPMAPRVAPKTDARPEPRLESRPESRPETRTVVQPNPEALAERLKSQREAAEKLAEQRVQAARQKAELAAAQRNQGREPPKPAAPTAEAARPKFVFAEEDASAAAAPTELPALPRRTPAKVTASVTPSRPAQQPATGMMPPRPALGMDRPPLPPRPAAPPQRQPVNGQTNAYKPLDPTANYTPPPPIFPQRQYTVPPAMTPPPPPGRTVPPQARPPYFPGAVASPAGEPGLPPGSYGEPQLGRAPVRPNMRPAPSIPPGALHDQYGDDIFETPTQRPSRRQTAGDYQAAYREQDYGYEYEQPRSSGPWVLFLALLLAGALAAAGMWFYQTQIKGQGLNTATQGTSVPTVDPPAEPAKTLPEQPDATGKSTNPPISSDVGNSVVPATTKKQIYDRIVGDREVLGGQMVPTEELPLAPADAGTPAAAGADPAAAPANELPPVTDDAAPLPLPPPPGQTGGEQGALTPQPDDQPGGQESQTTVIATNAPPAASASQAADVSLDQVIEPIEGESRDAQALAKAAGQAAAVQDQLGTAPGSGVEAIAPPPVSPPPSTLQATESDQVAAVEPSPQTASQAPLAAPPANEAASTATEGETISDEPLQPTTSDDGQAAKPVVEKPVAVTKPKEKAAQKKKAKPKNTTGSEPVVLVDQGTSNSSGVATSENVLYGGGTQSAGQSAQAEPTKKKTLFDLLNKNGGNSSAPPAANEDQVASIAKPPKKTVLAPQPDPQPAPQATQSGSGYVAQLALYRSAEEANGEFGRMKAKYPQVLGGMSPQIKQVTVLGSTRYRLAVGPMSSQQAASRVCSQLMSAGERDCIPKRQ